MKKTAASAAGAFANQQRFGLYVGVMVKHIGESHEDFPIYGWFEKSGFVKRRKSCGLGDSITDHIASK